MTIEKEQWKRVMTELVVMTIVLLATMAFTC